MSKTLKYMQINATTSVFITKITFRSGVAPVWSRGAIRLSVGRATTKEEIDRTAHVLWEAYQKLQPANGAEK